MPDQDLRREPADEPTNRQNQPEVPAPQVPVPQVADPAPQPTAFGAPTVGGAVAAAAMAGPSRAGEPDVRDEETVAPEDGSFEEQAPS